MTRTRYVLPDDPLETWDVWIGPGPEPKTGRRFGAIRWRNHYHDRAVHDRRSDQLALADLAFLRELLDPIRPAGSRGDPVGLIRRELAGLRLGTSRPRHGLVLSRLADGVDRVEILEQLRQLEPETLDLFPREVPCE